jgi:hypothetical protein
MEGPSNEGRGYAINLKMWFICMGLAKTEFQMAEIWQQL